MGILGAYAGGSLPYSHYLDKIKATWLPEALIGLMVAYPYYLALSGWWLVIFPVVAFWSYIWFQTGHANALPWGDGNHNPERENTLSPLVKWLSDRFGIEYYSKNYARLFMAVKGFLISLPVGGLGFFLFPLGYEIGHKLKKHWVSEVLSCAGIGINVVMFI